MSRVYITASMPHSTFGIAMPVFSIESTDHTGGSFAVGGLHPTSIAKMAGKLPEVKKGERFDFKFNINAKRTSVALVVATSKHLPHLDWSSEKGMGKLPLGVGALASTLLMGGGSKEISKEKSKSKSKDRSPSKHRENRGHYQEYHDSPRESSSYRSHSSARSQSSAPREKPSHRSRHRSARDSDIGRSHRSEHVEMEVRRIRQASPRYSEYGGNHYREASPRYSEYDGSHHSSRSKSNRDYRWEEPDSGYASSENYKRNYRRDSRSSRYDSRRR
ncbi:hypothetical protein BP5796_06674 [Coleophoma crateriformis]|uniref:Uncharacterized protein n=1 Tax=Coleophoma crateriformis TaxID=565419 RepID=A0A3D8RP74_9HELO|nr:hypothetical protein BP5796_06674 [Coleophoma crateriformis]